MILRDFLLGALIGSAASLFVMLGAQHITIHLTNQTYDQCRAQFSRETRCFTELEPSKCGRLIQNLCGDDE